MGKTEVPDVEAGTNTTGRIDFNAHKHEFVSFVYRGDRANFDYYVGDLITNGDWQRLDLGAIVPSGAKAVALVVQIGDNLVSKFIDFRKNGDVGGYNFSRVRTQVGNIYISADVIVFCDVNRVIEYLASNVVWTGIWITVKGWWV